MCCCPVLVALHGKQSTSEGGVCLFLDMQEQSEDICACFVVATFEHYRNVDAEQSQAALTLVLYRYEKARGLDRVSNGQT